MAMAALLDSRVLSSLGSSSSKPVVPVRIARRSTRRVALGWSVEAPRPSTVRASATSDAADPNKSAYSPLASIHIDEKQVQTRFIAETLLPTRHGKFRLRGYKHSVDGGVTFTEPTAIVSGSVEGKENVAVRVHDACFTSEVLGSLKCDCAEQLELALNMIQKEPPGIVIYLQQEGRGIGLANKIAAYSLQEQGLDTVDANRALGLPDDCREYTSVRNMLTDMGVKSVRLITNNPRKMNVLTKLGIHVSGRIPCLIEAGAYNQGYLEAKRDRMAHMLPEEVDSVVGPESGELNGQFCFYDHDGEPTQPVAAAVAKGGMDLPAGLAHGDGGRVVPVGMSTATAQSVSMDSATAASGKK